MYHNSLVLYMQPQKKIIINSIILKKICVPNHQHSRHKSTFDVYSILDAISRQHNESFIGPGNCSFSTFRQQQQKFRFLSTCLVLKSYILNTQVYFTCQILLLPLCFTCVCVSVCPHLWKRIIIFSWLIRFSVYCFVLVSSVIYFFLFLIQA